MTAQNEGKSMLDNLIEQDKDDNMYISNQKDKMEEIMKEILDRK